MNGIVALKKAKEYAKSLSYGDIPEVTVTQTDTGATISVTNTSGTTTANISNGVDGADGYSPTATVEQTDTGATITITDANGTTNASITADMSFPIVNSGTVEAGSSTYILCSTLSGLYLLFLEAGASGACYIYGGYTNAIGVVNELVRYEGSATSFYAEASRDSDGTYKLYIYSGDTYDTEYKLYKLPF